MKASLIGYVDQRMERVFKLDHMTAIKLLRKNISDSVLPLSEGTGMRT